MEILKENHELNYSEDLNKKINQIKKEMNELAEIYGINHELTVLKSQELDRILNEIMTPNKD